MSKFPMGLLKGKRVIGCNAACYLGVEIIPIVVFGDSKFLPQHGPAVERFVKDGGWAISSTNNLAETRPEWLKWMPRKVEGLGVTELGWNNNTGAMAINVALLFGADPIYLLGFDMQPIQGKANFHNHYGTGNVHPASYVKFQKGMAHVYKDLDALFPKQRVINLEDGTSALEGFPKESLKEHFNL